MAGPLMAVMNEVIFDLLANPAEIAQDLVAEFNSLYDELDIEHK